MKSFFLLASLIFGAVFTLGSAGTAKTLWLVLALLAFGMAFIRRGKRPEKVRVRSEFTEYEIREMYAALAAARSSASTRDQPFTENNVYRRD